VVGAVRLAAGLFTRAEGQQIHRNAKLAAESFERGDWPFARQWVEWRPEREWRLPELPADAVWQLDLTCGER
jgi:hypothetical protein